MSLLVTNCHGYKVTGLSGWPASPDKVWAVAWFKVDSTTGGARRAIVQVSDDTLDSTHDYFGVTIDGSNVVVANARTGNVNVATPDPGTFYLWNGANQNKWTVASAVIDRTLSATDVKCIFGRAAATAVSATTQTASGDLSAFSDQLVDVYVGGDLRKVKDGTGTTNDSTDGIKIAYVAIGHGSVPSQSNIQSVIDGMHPADLAGVFEYWDLTSSSSGLVGALTSATLVPYGGSATTTWDGADNPTVSPPAGSGASATITGTTALPEFSGSAQVAPVTSITVTAALPAFSGGASTGSASATVTATTSLPSFSGSATGDTSSGVLTLPVMKNNTGTVLANETGATVHVYAVSTGNKVVTKTGQTTNASGVMTVTDALIVGGTQYRVVVVLGSGAEGLDKVTAS